MATSKPRRIVDRAGVAAYLATTERNIRHLVETRRIPFVRMGERTIRFDLDQIDAWLDEHTTEAAS